MINLQRQLEQISSVSFFSSLGQPLAEELAPVITPPNSPFLQHMQLPNVEETFVHPKLPEWIKLQQTIRWLPSSPTEPDPFYPELSASLDPELREIRRQINQVVLRQTRTARPDTLMHRPHDFTTTARQAAAYAYRQYAAEHYLKLGNRWETIINLYEAGHWPVGYGKDILVWL